MCVCVFVPPAACLFLSVVRPSWPRLLSALLSRSHLEFSCNYFPIFSPNTHTHPYTHIRLWLRDRSVVSESGASMRRLWQLQLQVQHVAAAAAGFQF